MSNTILSERCWPTERVCPTCQGQGVTDGGRDYYGEYWVEECSACEGQGVMLWMRPNTKAREREAARIFGEFILFTEF
jgi:DnaJ-class molecular chaperone